MYMYIYTYTHTYMYIRIFLHTSMHICTYVHIYTYSNASCQHRATRVRYSIVLDVLCQPCQGLPAVSC